MPPRGLGAKKERPKNAKGTTLRILKYVMNYRYVVLALLVLTLISNVGNLLGPTFAGKAIGAAVGKGQVDFDTVAFYAGCMLAAYLLGNIMSFLATQGMMRMGRRVARKMRQDVFAKLMALPVSYFDRNQAGDIISRVSYDIDVVTTSLSADLIQILTSVITVGGSFLMMCLISPPMVLCLAVTLPLAVFFARYMGKKTRPLYARRSAAYGKMNGYVEEMFSGQKTILAYAYEEDVCQDFSAINHEAADAYRDADALGMTTGPTINMINNLGLSLIGMVGAALYLLGGVGMEQISSFVLYSRKFCGPINEIANIINEIYSALAAAERVFTLLDRGGGAGGRARCGGAHAGGGGCGGASRELWLYAGQNRAARFEPQGPAGTDHCHRGPYRRGQDHPHQPAHALLRRGPRTDSGGWPRCAQGDPRVPAPGLCDGPAGHLGIWRHRL